MKNNGFLVCQEHNYYMAFKEALCWHCAQNSRRDTYRLSHADFVALLRDTKTTTQQPAELTTMENPSCPLD